jgi:hypothetical protein
MEELEHQLAGLLSTIGFTPAEQHPELMLPMARNVLQLIDEFQPTDSKGESP